MCQSEQKRQRPNWESVPKTRASAGLLVMRTFLLSLSRRTGEDAVVVVYQLAKQICSSAWQGQILPRFTVVLFGQFAIHVFLFGSSPFLESTENNRLASARLLSLLLIILNTVLNVIGYGLLVRLYRHSVTTIFNRNLPNTVRQCIPSFGAHMAMLRPLETCWRYATARFRVLPDIIVLGEVRCGTTTLCHHLSDLPGCKQPFCLWKHPELDRKETFYFVGHYLGMVDPVYYRMCFPLAITKWFHRVVLRKPFFTFDGCAQYLTSPTAPYLIAQAYRLAGQPPPVLVACVRDPVDQAVSWWRFENNAMSWGSSMGLTTWNTDLRSSSYPPSTISNAVDFSSSEPVEQSYQKAEALAKNMISNPPSPFVFPSWALTWPSGQLSVIGRNGLYCHNIRRYERIFSEYFPILEKQSTLEDIYPSQSNLRHVNVVPLMNMKSTTQLSNIMTALMKQITTRQTENAPHLELASHGTIRSCSPVHRNATLSLQEEDKLLTPQEEARLIHTFSRDTQELESICGFCFGWKSSQLETGEETR